MPKLIKKSWPVYNSIAVARMLNSFSRKINGKNNVVQPIKASICCLRIWIKMQISLATV